MVKKVMAFAVMLAMVLASGAWAWTESLMIIGGHASMADMVNGKSDYSNARFFRFNLIVQDSEMLVTEELSKLTGEITISGGKYSFWNGRELQKVSGTPMTFTLIETTSLNGSLFFEVMDSNGNVVYFIPDAETGLNGANVSCHFPEMTSLDRAINLGSYRTAQEQLNKFVPCIEYIYDENDASKVTGLKYRAVVSSDLDTPIAADSAMNVFFYVYGANWNFLRQARTEAKPGWWFTFDPGDIVEGTVSFNEPVEASDIWLTDVLLSTQNYNEDPTGFPMNYEWYFFDNKLTPNIYLWRPHDSKAKLINGKSDYRDAKFDEVDLYIEAEDIIAEASYFTGDGTITVPGGGYTIVSDDSTDGVSSKKVLGTVEAGRDMTFGLRMRTGGSTRTYIGTTWAEYEVTDKNGRAIAFTGGAETGLNGRTITWTFPAELNMNGSNTLPNFKSTAEQLAGVVPYVEVISSDGNMTALNYRLVMSDDTSTAVTPAYRTDFRFYIESRDFEAGRAFRLFRSSWLNESSQGTFTFNEPIPLNQIYNVQVRLRSHEDSRRPVYIWHFFKAEDEPAPSPITIRTTALPTATENAPYTATLAANVSGVTWQVSSGTLPAGLTLNSSTGTISGIPTTEGTSTFKVTASMIGRTSAEKTFTLTVQRTPTPQTVEITTTTIPEGIAGMSYNASLASNPLGATWTLTGNLPAGLTLDSSGRISGTPTVAGEFRFTVTARYGTASDVRTLTITVKPLEIITSELPDGTVGDAYNESLTSNVSGLKWTVNSGTLPEGLTLNENTGLISGTLTEAGEYTFTVYAYNTHASASKSFTVNVSKRDNDPGPCSSFPMIFGAALLAFFIKRR